MKILFWLKKVFNFFSNKENNFFGEGKNPSFPVPNNNISSTSTAFPIQSISSENVNDLYSNLIKLKDDVTKDLEEFKKEVAVIHQLKIDAEKAVKKSEKNENLVYLGFLVLIFMVIALIFGYIEYIYSGSKNDDYKYNLNEKVSNQENEIKMLKLCLSTNKWLNPKCFEK